MKLYAVDPVSNRRLSVVIEGKVLMGLFGEVALSARILIDGDDDEEYDVTEKLLDMGYHNVEPMRATARRSK